jgi:hypothetical protein
MKSFEATIEPTPLIAAAVYRSLIWRSDGGYLIGSAILAGLAFGSLVSGNGSLLWAFWLGVVATYWFGLWIGARRVRDAFGNNSARTIALAIDKEGCTFRTADFSGWFSWREVAVIYDLKLALVIQMRSRSTSTPIPKNYLSDSERAAVIAPARSAGAQIR